MLAVALVASAQTNTPSPTITGSLDIQYGSRTQVDSNGKPTKGAKDLYTIKMNVANSAIFNGTITDYPLVMGGWMGDTVDQRRQLVYDVQCDVVNPKNPGQTKNVGRLFGKVGIEIDGSYKYDQGSLQMSILPMGNAGGFDSKFTGSTVGKPMNRPANWLESMQKTAVSITRSVNGKPMKVTLKKYDKMEFRNHTIGAGPVAIYPSFRVDGEMLYDYDKSCWFFNNFIAGQDRWSGNIRWIQSASEYQFDIRVNEPPPSESAAFTAAADESAFFETDTKTASLTGTMKYKDVVKGKQTIASTVLIDLTGNNLTKQQTMALAKIIVFSSAVPMNAD